MKKIKILAVVLLTVVFGSGMYAFELHIEVPQKVKIAFSKKFPNVNVVQWSMESANEWEAEFDVKGVEFSANFMEDGTWKETEHEIKKKIFLTILELW